MLEQRVMDLINAEIDGELGSEESAELETILRASAEARAMKTDLQKLAQVLEGMPEQEPPADLCDRIIGQVPLPARQAAGAAPKWSLVAWLGSFQPAQAGVAFAVGLLLTVAVYESSPPGGAASDLSSMVGTMVANPASISALQKERLSISAPGLSGTVSRGEMGDYVVLSFDLESAQQTEIEIDLAEAGLGFGGIAHAPAADHAVDEFFEVSGGTLRVVNQGRQVFSVFLPQVAGATADRATGQDGGGRAISIGISTAGATVFSGALQG